MKRYTPEFITDLKDDEVFVFGSNSTGFHGAGAAGMAFHGSAKNVWRTNNAFQKAMKAPVGHPDRIGRWAIYGVARGYMEGYEGKSYAIETIKHPGQLRSTSRREIFFQLLELNKFAKQRLDLTFLVTKIGCALAGYTPKEISEIFEFWCSGKYATISDNVILPEEFDFK